MQLMYSTAQDIAKTIDIAINENNILDPDKYKVRNKIYVSIIEQI